MTIAKTFLFGVRRRLPALVLCAAACGLSAWAGPKQVPFKAALATQETLGFDLERCAGGVVGTTTGKGNASHMGKVTMVATDCPLIIPGGPPPSFSEGKLTFKAANGDELRAVYQGSLQPVDIPNQVFSIVGQYNVTGGTGRFSNATGSGSLTGTITLGPEVSNGRYEASGTLSY